MPPAVDPRPHLDRRVIRRFRSNQPDRRQMLADEIRRTPPDKRLPPSLKRHRQTAHETAADLRVRVPARDGIRERLVDAQLVSDLRRQERA